MWFFIQRTAKRFKLAESPARDCYGIGKDPLRDETECREAAKELRQHFKDIPGSFQDYLDSSYPKECFSLHNTAYWNTHDIVMSRVQYDAANDVTPICRIEGDYRH